MFKKRIFPIYYCAYSKKSTPKYPVADPRLVHRMSCPNRPGAFNQLDVGSHTHIADALEEAKAKKPDWNFEACPCCVETEAGRIADA